MPIFRVKSAKIYTGQKNLHWRRQRQLSGMLTYRWFTVSIYSISFNKINNGKSPESEKNNLGYEQVGLGNWRAICSHFLTFWARRGTFFSLFNCLRPYRGCWLRSATLASALSASSTSSLGTRLVADRRAYYLWSNLFFIAILFSSDTTISHISNLLPS